MGSMGDRENESGNLNHDLVLVSSKEKGALEWCFHMKKKANEHYKVYGILRSRLKYEVRKNN